MFGAEYLSETPTWCLSGQQLAVRSATEHLGVVTSADLSGSQHSQYRIKRARGAFYGLTPVGILCENPSPLDKAFLWKVVVMPVLTFGSEVKLLDSHDISYMESLQSRCMKAALGLSKHAHHSALPSAPGIPRICMYIHMYLHEGIRRPVLQGLANAFRGGDHRLTHISYDWCADTFAVETQQLSGAFIGFAFQFLNGSFGAIVKAVGGHVNRDVVRGPIQPDGLIDSLRFLSDDPPVHSRRLLRLLCSYTALRCHTRCGMFCWCDDLLLSKSDAK